MNQMKEICAQELEGLFHLSWFAIGPKLLNVKNNVIKNWLKYNSLTSLLTEKKL